MALNNTFRVAIFDEFLDALYKIPRDQQKKVQRFFRKFREDPTSKSIDYEKIHSFADPNLRTVRIDKCYRAIVLRPKKGNVYVLLWVDKHDAAHAWARNKRCLIHPDTGTLQVFTSAPAPADETPPTPKKPPTAAKAKPKPKPKPATPLFAKHSNTELHSIGIPEALLPQVRALTSREELDQQTDTLPPDVYEALFFLASGESVTAIRQALGIDKAEPVDPENFEAALDQPNTKRRFAVVAHDQELAAMLDAPLEKWRVFLHPSQRTMVTRTNNGPARVLGGAGTGKTVVAMHRAKHLVTEVFNDEADRLLFTTFTNNLARDIQANLSKLCPPKALRRIEVVHLDKWVADFLKRQGYRYTIVYWPNPKLKNLWDKALAEKPTTHTKAFCREEWDYIVQPQGCSSYEDYKRVKRTGRGTGLSRKQRKELWPVFAEYRNLLEARGLRESVDAMRDAANLLEHRQGQVSYRAIIVDEAQDMTTVAFKLLRQIIPTEAPNDLFIVGDGHQRIYRRKVVLKQAGVNIVGRSRKLYVNYRTTDEIRRYAVGILEDVEIDDLDGGTDNNQRYKSLVHGEPPVHKGHKSFRAELKTIVAFAKAGELHRTCLVARTNDELQQYEAELKQAGIETYPLKRSEPENHEAKGLRLATMHRVKGLEFDRVIIASMNDKVVPLAKGDLLSDDEAVREEAETRERALFYVAVTRARKQVLLTSFGKPSPWLL